MRVRISDLSPQGMKLDEELPLEGINQRMNEGRGNDVQFVSPPHASVTITKQTGGAELAGTVHAKVRQPCALCMREVERDLTAPANYILKEKRSGGRRDEELTPEEEAGDDVGVAYYEGDHVELEDLLQESLILELSPFWRPDTDAKGCCTACGKNCEKPVTHEEESKTSFGDLLKAAQSKKR